MEEDRIYQNIQKALEDLPENFSILEEQIDIDIQMKYFEHTKEMRSKEQAKEAFDNREVLFDEEVDKERKKEVLTNLALYDDVKAYRTLEKFVKESKGVMKQWGILAMQESRMLLQSTLLDEQQVFISTGLGGKDKKLRYFIVFINHEKENLLTNSQQKLLKDELIFELNKYEGIFESMDFMAGFSSALVMLPLSVDIKSIFQNVIDECNQYGGFLQEDMIITNVKVMSRGEIIQLLHQKKKDENNDLEKE